MPLTKNKDEAGDFTDHAIEVVEKENERLADMIHVPLEEFHEAVADATFRTGFDYLEQEILIMYAVAWNLLVRRLKMRLADGFNRKRCLKIWTIGTLLVASAVFFILGAFAYIEFFTAQRATSEILTVATIYAGLFASMILTSMVMTAAAHTLHARASRDLEILGSLDEESNELLDDFSRKMKETKGVNFEELIHFLIIVRCEIRAAA